MNEHPSVIEAVKADPKRPVGLHLYPLGSVVDIDLDFQRPGGDAGIEVSLKGTCRLYIVGHTLGHEGEPMYLVSDLPVRYPLDKPPSDVSRMVYRFFAQIVEQGPATRMRSTGQIRPLQDNITTWLG
jgi:hypothetical protein